MISKESISILKFRRSGKLDKSGHYSRMRRYEKMLLREGYVVKPILFASITLPARSSDGKGAISIYRDGIVRVSRHRRRPDVFNLPEEIGDT